MSRNISQVFRPLDIDAPVKRITFSLICIEHGFWDSSADKKTRLTVGWPRNRGSIPCEGDRFSSSPKLGMFSIFFCKYRELFPWGWSSRKMRLLLTCIRSYVYECVELYLHSNPLLFLFTGLLHGRKVYIRKFLWSSISTQAPWFSCVFK